MSRIEEMAREYVEELDYIDNQHRRMAGNGFLAGARAALGLAADVAQAEADSEQRWMKHYEEKVKDLEERDARAGFNTATGIANDIRALMPEEKT
jgi:demethoxyubiquinone hydroxylase (CLK1/Coq7/Cat5 family)